MHRMVPVVGAVSGAGGASCANEPLPLVKFILRFSPVKRRVPCRHLGTFGLAETHLPHINGHDFPYW